LGTGQQPSRRQNLTGQKKPTLRQQAQLTPVALRETAGIRIVPNERKRQSQSIGCATARVILHQFSSINLSEQIHLTTGEGTLVLFPDFSLGISCKGDFQGRARLGTFGQATARI